MITTTMKPNHTVARDHCLAPARASRAALAGARYGRLFPEPPPLDLRPDQLRALGQLGGLCDASDGFDYARGVAAGWPIFGQYIAHDLTADRSALTMRADVDALVNFHSPRANLECLYGDGPSAQPFMYSHADGAKLLLNGHDLPRNSEGVALIPDPRQDVHVPMSQLQVGLARMHNRLVDRLRQDGVPEGELFEEARRAATWHYQWVILNGLLPTAIGPERAARLLSEGPRLFLSAGETPYIPLEFADGAYRYGHSQVRGEFHLNHGGSPLRLSPDLVGFQPLPPEKAIDWRLFFDVPGEPPAQRAKKIDGRLCASLMALPAAIVGSVRDPELASLALRDLKRGVGTGLPSGEAVARALGEEPLTPAKTGLDGVSSWEGETPLWYYVLKEAELHSDGERLGPVGGTIVGEVLVGVIDRDPESYRAVDPGWRPTLPSREAGRFTIADALVPNE